MVKFDYNGIVATSGYDAVVFLSAESKALVNAALAIMSDRWRWENYADYDAVDAAVAQVNYEVTENMLIGSVIWVVGAVPVGTLECDGAAHARADYPLLYDVLPAAYILDAGTFTVPDLRGSFIRSVGTGLAVGDSGGEATHTLTEAEMPTHSHSYVPPTINIDIEAPGVPDPVAAGIGLPTSTGNAGSSQPHNNLPPFVVLRPCLIAN